MFDAPTPHADLARGFPILPPCPAWLVDGPLTLHALWEATAALRASHPGHRPLAVLAAEGQAFYTATHGTMTHDLDQPSEEDLPRLSPEDRAFWEAEGVLEGPASLPVILANLRRGAAGLTMADLAGAAPDLTGNSQYCPLRAMAGEVPVTDPRIPFYLADVARAADLVAVLPNGYFSGDLTPFQTYALAAHFETAHGLALFGIGAPYLAFRSEDLLTTDAAKAIAADIATLYEADPAPYAAALTGQRWVILTYAGA